MGANKRPAGHSQCVLTLLPLEILSPGANPDAPGSGSLPGGVNVVELWLSCLRSPGAYCDAPGSVDGPVWFCIWWPGDDAEAPPLPDLPPACATVASVALDRINVTITAVREILISSPRVTTALPPFVTAEDALDRAELRQIPQPAVIRWPVMLLCNILFDACWTPSVSTAM